MRTRSFWIGILIFPLILTLSVVMPAVLERTRKARQFAVLDRSGWVLDAVRPRLAGGAKRFTLVKTALAPDAPAAEDSLNRRVRDEELFAYFIIGPDPVEGSAGSRYLSLAMVPIGRDPNGTLAKVLSVIPPFTPFVMMNRAAGPPALWEYVATTGLLLVSIALALWAAAKVFRIGVLLTGKPPKLGQILRWIRGPVGTVVVRREH